MQKIKYLKHGGNQNGRKEKNQPTLYDYVINPKDESMGYNDPGSITHRKTGEDDIPNNEKSSYSALARNLNNVVTKYRKGLANNLNIRELY